MKEAIAPQYRNHFRPKSKYRCRVNQHSSGNLYIRFEHNKKPYTISLGIKVQDKERWDQKQQRLISDNREKRARIQFIKAHFHNAIPEFKRTGDKDLLIVPIAPSKDDKKYGTIFYLLEEYKRTVGKHLGTIKTLKYNLTEYPGTKHRGGFDPEDFYLYLKKVCKVSSANHRMTILKRMFKVVWKEDIYFSKSKATPKAIFCFEKTELDDLFELEPVTKAEQNLLYGYELLYRTGLRFADLPVFQKQFNHRGKETSVVTSKTKKPVTIQHTPRIVDLVMLYRPIPIAYANTELKKLCERAGLNRIIQGNELWELASCHIFRKSFATQLHRKGVDLLQIKEILCHGSIETTQRYIVPAPLKVNVFGLT